MIKVSVCDNGIGIQKNDLTKLFKLFGFLESSKEINSKGIGLGLFICKKISNTYGGDVSVQSEVNKGSEFSFTFMLSKKSSDVQSISRIFNPY